MPTSSRCRSFRRPRDPEGRGIHSSSLGQAATQARRSISSCGRESTTAMPDGSHAGLGMLMIPRNGCPSDPIASPPHTGSPSARDRTASPGLPARPPPVRMFPAAHRPRPHPNLNHPVPGPAASKPPGAHSPPRKHPPGHPRLPMSPCGVTGTALPAAAILGPTGMHPPCSPAFGSPRSDIGHFAGGKNATEPGPIGPRTLPDPFSGLHPPSSGRTGRLACRPCARGALTLRSREATEISQSSARGSRPRPDGRGGRIGRRKRCVPRRLTGARSPGWREGGFRRGDRGVAARGPLGRRAARPTTGIGPHAGTHAAPSIAHRCVGRFPSPFRPAGSPSGRFEGASYDLTSPGFPASRCLRARRAAVRRRGPVRASKGHVKAARDVPELRGPAKRRRSGARGILEIGFSLRDVRPPGARTGDAGQRRGRAFGNESGRRDLGAEAGWAGAWPDRSGGKSERPRRAGRGLPGSEARSDAGRDHAEVRGAEREPFDGHQPRIAPARGSDASPRARSAVPPGAGSPGCRRPRPRGHPSPADRPTAPRHRASGTAPAQASAREAPDGGQGRARQASPGRPFRKQAPRETALRSPGTGPRSALEGAHGRES